MYDIEADIENVATVLHNGHNCMSWKEAQVLARAALNASTAVKSHQLLVEALKRTYSAISHLREMKQPTKAMIAKWCDDGDKVIGAALKAARGEAVEAHLQLGMPIEEIIPLIGELWVHNQAMQATIESIKKKLNSVKEAVEALILDVKYSNNPKHYYHTDIDIYDAEYSVIVISQLITDLENRKL